MVRNVFKDSEKRKQLADRINYVMAGTTFVGSLVEKHLQIDSFIEKNQECLLVGNNDVIKMVRTRFDFRKRGLAFWKTSCVTEINDENKEDYEKKFTKKADVHLIICTSVDPDVSKKQFWLPSTATVSPSDIKRKSIVIVQKRKDTEEDVKQCIESLRSISEIKTLSPNQELVVSGNVKIELKGLLWAYFSK